MSLRHIQTAAARSLLGLLLAAAGSPIGGHSQDEETPSFTTFSVAATPPQSAGTVCPGSDSACFNNAAEPQIRADNDGTFYASSENGLGGGTDAWKSTDGGRHFATLSSPNAGSSTNNTGFAPGGGDTDLAVAPIKNALGFYNVYIASLSLADVDVSTSQNGGQTWSLNPIGASIPLDDREWIAADGASKVCISYHDIATFNIDVNCSFDAGLTFTQLGTAIDANHLFLVNNNQIGNLAIDPNSHVVYQVFNGIANADEVVCGQLGTCGFRAVWIGVSIDGGKTFVDRLVFNNPDTTASYNHQFVNVSIDRAGNAYAVFSDNHNVFLSFSKNQGTTWSNPVQVNRAPANTAIFPWSVAGDAGKIDIVYYGSSFFDGVTPPDNYPSDASWNVYFAQNLNVLADPTAFTQTVASPVVHFGGVCESGIACSGNRDLFDDFGVAASPITGMATIIYSDDQYRNDSNNVPSPSCTPKRTNTIFCDHTSIATQMSGPGIFGTG